MRKGPICSTLLVLIAGGCEPPDEGMLEEVGVETTTAPILSGTGVTSNTLHLAALYHQTLENGSYSWFPRPCTATRLDYEGWYLTARHCVTQDGTPEGIALDKSRLKLTEALSPGLAPPPSSAVAITRIESAPNGWDIALVLAPGAGTATQGQLGGLYLAPTLGLLSANLRSYGYGRNVLGSDTGAGTLRTAILHVNMTRRMDYPTSGSPGIIRMKTNSSGQLNSNGDSGGPSYFEIASGGATVRLQTGVHQRTYMQDDLYASYTEDQPALDVIGWIGNTIGWMYIKRIPGATGTGAQYLDVQWNNAASQTPVWTWTLSDSAAQHWKYDPVAKTIRNELGKCLDVKYNGTANGTPVWMWDCTGGVAQQWTFTSSHGIKNANGKCLDVPAGASGTPLQIWDCLGNTNQQWMMSGAP